MIFPTTSLSILLELSIDPVYLFSYHPIWDDYSSNYSTNQFINFNLSISSLPLNVLNEFYFAV
jgi:hypothetical protein